MIKVLERSKKYTTETEQDESNSETIKLNKDGSPCVKSRFNARSVLKKMSEQRQKNQ